MQAEPSAAQRTVIARSGAAFAVAAAVGLAALIAPPAALLILALLAARALTRGPAFRFDFLGVAGPLCAALGAAAFGGVAAGVGVLFVWRVFSDARWSVREAGRLARAAGRPGETGGAALGHAWLTPLYGVTVVAYTAPHMVAGLPLDLPHLPYAIPLGAAAAAALGVFDWALRRAADWRLGELAAAPAVHLAAHHGVFLLAFGFALDVSAGLVALIAWRLAHAAPLAFPALAPAKA